MLVRQVLGAIAQFDKATMVAKLKAARDRKRKVTGKVEGQKSYIEREGGLSLIARVKALRDHMAEGEELGSNILQVVQRIVAKPSVCPSEPREVARQFPIEFGEIARDHRYVEMYENRLLRLAVEQETERRLETTLRRLSTDCQPVARFSRHRDVVMGLTSSFTNDHLESEGVILRNAPDLDHVDLLSRLRNRSLSRHRRANLAETSE